jgi:hypothetical protein
MGGQSSSTQTQQSQTAPWEAAQPMLRSILGQLSTGLSNTGLTGAETSALNTLQSNAARGNPYAAQIGGYAQSLLSGGGADAQAGNLRDNLGAFRSQLTPYASGSMVGNNPALASQLAQIRDDVANSVNGQVARFVVDCAPLGIAQHRRQRPGGGSGSSSDDRSAGRGRQRHRRRDAG